MINDQRTINLGKTRMTNTLKKGQNGEKTPFAVQKYKKKMI